MMAMTTKISINVNAAFMFLTSITIFFFIGKHQSSRELGQRRLSQFHLIRQDRQDNLRNYLSQEEPRQHRLSQLLKSASLELDNQKRAKIGQEFEALWAEELPSLPLFFRVDVSITKKGLKNWKPTGILQPVTWNSQEWSWTK